MNGEHAGAAPEGEGEDPGAMERRIFRGMCATALVATIVSAPFAPWRVTTGVMLGGLLSLFNHEWLRTSVAAMFGETLEGARPKFKVARYILRYIVVAGIVAAAYKLNLVSLAATLAGMCTFVVAALVEGFRQLYLAVVQREET
ncbi:MAG TPA: ATP synthase subunit I [Pyrinomonadaceae bacterium]|nr:ATP synthase subunit I [Pyrinomonadaceae bacterium]